MVTIPWMVTLYFQPFNHCFSHVCVIIVFRGREILHHNGQRDGELIFTTYFVLQSFDPSIMVGKVLLNPLNVLGHFSELDHVVDHHGLEFQGGQLLSVVLQLVCQVLQAELTWRDSLRIFGLAS